jgi:hypothetical protein
MITDLELHILNERLRRELPSTPGGAPQYKWMRTEDVTYLVQEGQSKRYKQASWADRLGRGWVLARWRPPSFTEAEWLRQFGSFFPYPANGTYGPVENVLLISGMEPNENLTNQVIHRVTEQIGKKEQQFTSEAEDAAAKELAAQKAEARDMVHDAFPAFGNIPGKKYDVSFPTPQPPTEQKGLLSGE